MSPNTPPQHEHKIPAQKPSPGEIMFWRWIAITATFAFLIFGIIQSLK